jgi:uncharacterized protein
MTTGPDRPPPREQDPDRPPPGEQDPDRPPPGDQDHDPPGDQDHDPPGDQDQDPPGDQDQDPSGNRDRDRAGRARNARPRDALGRPLPRGERGEPTMPEDLALAPAAALALAQRLLDEGRPFHAHEVLEAAWKAAPAVERELWRGLAQIAVGLTHARRGNATGAAALLRRGGLRVAAYAGRAPYGIDADAVAGQAVGLAARIDESGLATGSPTFMIVKDSQ